MSRAATTYRRRSDHALLTGFTLTTAAREMVSRFVQAEQQPALPLLRDVLELEAQERHERRITRLRRASKLPPGKTFATLDEGRLPPALVRRSTSSPRATSSTTRPMSCLRPARRRQEPRDVRRRPRARRSRPRRALHADLQPRAGAARREAESGLAARLTQTRSLRGAGSSTMWATSSRVPKRLRFSSRSSPNATSDARSSSPAI